MLAIRGRICVPRRLDRRVVDRLREVIQLGPRRRPKDVIAVDDRRRVTYTANRQHPAGAGEVAGTD